MITYYTRQRRQGRRGRAALGHVRDARADGPRLPQGARVRAPGRARRQGHPAPLAENDAQALVVRRVPARRSARWRSPSASRRSRRTRFRVSDTPPFPWSRADRRGRAHDLQPHARSTARSRRASRLFLDRATDVAAWAKLTMNCRFALEYISKAGALRYYYPDFVVRLTDDSCLIVETKGQEDLDVALKDRRARRWCEDATRLSGRDVGLREGPPEAVRRLYRAGPRWPAALYRRGRYEPRMRPIAQYRRSLVGG